MPSQKVPQQIIRFLSLAKDDVDKLTKKSNWNALYFPEPLRTVWAVEAAEGVISNGGLGYFFENDWRMKPPYTLFSDAYRLIGATEVADLLDESVSNFPFSNPHLDFEARRKHLNLSLKASPHEKDIYDRNASRILNLEYDTSLKLVAYIKSNISYFPSVPPEGVVDTKVVSVFLHAQNNQRVVIYKYIIGKKDFRIDFEILTESGWQCQENWCTLYPNSLLLTIKMAELLVPWMKDRKNFISKKLIDVYYYFRG